MNLSNDAFIVCESTIRDWQYDEPIKFRVVAKRREVFEVGKKFDLFFECADAPDSLGNERWEPAEKYLREVMLKTLDILVSRD